jgi:hypothetical protein
VIGAFDKSPRLTQQLYLEMVDEFPGQHTLCAASGGVGKSLLMVMMARAALRRAEAKGVGHLVIFVNHRVKISEDLDGVLRDALYDIDVTLFAGGSGGVRSSSRSSESQKRKSADDNTLTTSLLESFLQCAGEVHLFSATPPETSFYKERGFRRFQVEPTYSTLVAETCRVVPMALQYGSNIWKTLGPAVIEKAEAKTREILLAHTKTTPEDEQTHTAEVWAAVMALNSDSTRKVPGVTCAEVEEEMERRRGTSLRASRVPDRHGNYPGRVSHTLSYLANRKGWLSRPKTMDGRTSFRTVLLGTKPEESVARTAVAQVSLHLVNSQDLKRRGMIETNVTWGFTEDNIHAEIYREISKMLGNEPDGIEALDRLSCERFGTAYTLPGEEPQPVLAYSTERGNNPARAKNEMLKALDVAREHPSSRSHILFFCTQLLDTGVDLRSLTNVCIFGLISCKVDRLTQIMFRGNRTDVSKKLAYFVLYYRDIEAQEAQDAQDAPKKIRMKQSRLQANTAQTVEKVTLAADRPPPMPEKKLERCSLDGSTTSIFPSDPGFMLAGENVNNHVSPPAIEWSAVSALAFAERKQLQDDPELSALVAHRGSEAVLLLTADRKRGQITHSGQKWKYFGLSRIFHKESLPHLPERENYPVVLPVTRHKPGQLLDGSDASELIEILREQIQNNKQTPKAMEPYTPQLEFEAYIINHRKIGKGQNLAETAKQYLRCVEKYLVDHNLGVFKRDSELAQRVCAHFLESHGLHVALTDTERHIDMSLDRFREWCVEEPATKRRRRAAAEPGEPVLSGAKRARCALRAALPGMECQKAFRFVDYVYFLQHEAESVSDRTRKQYVSALERLLSPTWAAIQTDFIGGPISNTTLDNGNEAEVLLYVARIKDLAEAIPTKEHASDLPIGAGANYRAILAVMNKQWDAFVASRDKTAGALV